MNNDKYVWLILETIKKDNMEKEKIIKASLSHDDIIDYYRKNCVFMISEHHTVLYSISKIKVE